MDKEKELSEDLFWMVHVEAMTATRPTKKHLFKDEAITEAKRLALKHPDHKVYILEVVGYCTVGPTPVNFTDYFVQGKPINRIKPLDSIPYP